MPAQALTKQPAAEAERVAEGEEEGVADIEGDLEEEALLPALGVTEGVADTEELGHSRRRSTLPPASAT
jgi:hypothetical protein